MRKEPFKILLLDDDVAVLTALTEFLNSEGYLALPCITAREATTCVKEPVDFAVVDLFLDGDQGEHLSNLFIQLELLPRSIPYVRLTSAPKLVPENLQGLGVFDKRRFFEAPEELSALLKQVLL